jgi:hypothetical protein
VWSEWYEWYEWYERYERYVNNFRWEIGACAISALARGSPDERMRHERHERYEGYDGVGAV